MSPETQAPGWEWYYIAMYFFVGGVAAGAYFIGSLVELFGLSDSPRQQLISRTAYYIAFPLILITPVLLIGDLGQPLRFWHLIWNPVTGGPSFNGQSPMSVGSWALLVFGLMAFLSFHDNLAAAGHVHIRPLARAYNRVPRKIYAAIGSLAGFFVAGYTGVLVNTTARTFWEASSPLLGFLFIVSAASMGAAAIYLVLSVRRLVGRRRASAEAPGGAGEAAAPMPPEVPARELESFEYFDRLVKFLELGLALAVVFLAGQYARPLLSGPYAVMFWVGALLLGTLVPLIINWFGNRPGRRSILAPWLALLMSALVLFGGALLRISIVQAGQV